MEELVAKKMALAELSENHARLKRDLHRRAERDKVQLLATPLFNRDTRQGFISSLWSSSKSSAHPLGCLPCRCLTMVSVTPFAFLGMALRTLHCCSRCPECPA